MLGEWVLMLGLVGGWRLDDVGCGDDGGRGVLACVLISVRSGSLSLEDTRISFL